MARLALTVWQPWAHLICAAVKDVENRRWRPPELPLRVVVHAGKNPNPVVCRAFSDLIDVDALTFGALIGEITVRDVARDASSRWADAGQWHWLLEDPVLYDKPIAWRGQLGLFEIPDDALAASR